MILNQFDLYFPSFQFYDNDLKTKEITNRNILKPFRPGIYFSLQHMQCCLQQFQGWIQRVKNICTVGPRFNKLPRDCGNWFVEWRVCHIEVRFSYILL